MSRPFVVRVYRADSQLPLEIFPLEPHVGTSAEFVIWLRSPPRSDGTVRRMAFSLARVSASATPSVPLVLAQGTIGVGDSVEVTLGVGSDDPGLPDRNRDSGHSGNSRVVYTPNDRDIPKPAERTAYDSSITPSFRPVLPLIVLRDAVVLPGAVLPLVASTAHDRSAVDHATNAGGQLALVQEDDVRSPRERSRSPVACAARIVSMSRSVERDIVVVQGVARTEIGDVDRSGPHWSAKVKALRENTSVSDVERRRLAILREEFKRVVASPSIDELVASVRDPSRAVDLIVANLSLSVAELARALRTVSLTERVTLALEAITRLFPKS